MLFSVLIHGGQSNACISPSGYESGDFKCCYYSVRATATDKQKLNRSPCKRPHFTISSVHACRWVNSGLVSVIPVDPPGLSNGWYNLKTAMWRRLATSGPLPFEWRQHPDGSQNWPISHSVRSGTYTLYVRTDLGFSSLIQSSDCARVCVCVRERERERVFERERECVCVCQCVQVHH